MVFLISLNVKLFISILSAIEHASIKFPLVFFTISKTPWNTGNGLVLNPFIIRHIGIVCIFIMFVLPSLADMRSSISSIFVLGIFLNKIMLIVNNTSFLLDLIKHLKSFTDFSKDWQFTARILINFSDSEYERHMTTKISDNFILTDYSYNFTCAAYQNNSSFNNKWWFPSF